MIDALVTELARAKDSLQIDGLAEPYYVAYRVNDGTTLDVEGSFGSLLQLNRNRLRLLTSEVRVGSHQFDNSDTFMLEIC